MLYNQFHGSLDCTVSGNLYKKCDRQYSKNNEIRFYIFGSIKILDNKNNTCIPGALVRVHSSNVCTHTLQLAHRRHTDTLTTAR